MKYLFLIVLLSSCSASWHLKQAERHIRKAQIMGAKERIDTVFITKEIVIPQVKVDTLFKRVDFRDTITLVKDKVITKVKVDTITKAVYISTVCPPDTLKIEVPFTVTKEVYSGWPWWWLLIAICGGLTLGLILRKRI